ncbi:hypothetical protein AB0H98_14995 [Nocardia salmonicida]|uniref:hypothetical protein n=1 Tax=Nocardia salmonicida TaxID=53431 RepID=UPI0033FFFF5B
MQILASALPGFRDLRAPLTAGYMWVVFTWLVTTPSTKERPSGKTLGAAYDLATSVGPIWIAIAVSSMAYLVGAASQMLSDVLRGVLVALAVKLDRSPLARKSNPQSSVKTIDKIRRNLDDELDAASDRVPDSYGHLANAIRSHAEDASRAAELEPDVPAMLLVDHEPQLYSEVDRLRAEGELRLAAVPPLAAIVVQFAVAQSWWYLLLLLIPAALAYQGSLRVSDSQWLVEMSIAVGRIDSPTVREFRSWAKDFAVQHWNAPNPETTPAAAPTPNVPANLPA